MLSVQNDGDQTCGKRHFPSFRCVGFSDCRHRLPDSRLLTIRLWSTCTRKFSKAWERWIFSGRWPAMVASKRFFHRSPKMWQMQNSPELRPFCVCLFYAIYNVVFSMTANSHPAQARLIGSPESQGLNKSQVFWNLTRLQEKKTNNIYPQAFLCWNSDISTSYHNISYTWYHPTKKSNKRHWKTLPARLEDCGLACEKT